MPKASKTTKPGSSRRRKAATTGSMAEEADLVVRYKAVMEENRLLRSALEGLLMGHDGAVLRLGTKSPKVKAAQAAVSLGRITEDWHRTFDRT